MHQKKTTWAWYRPIDRALERLLKVYMPLELWGMVVIGVLSLIALVVGLSGGTPG